MQAKQIAVYGAGGFGREVAWLAQSCSGEESKYEVVCFIDDSARLYGSNLNAIPVMSMEETRRRFPEAGLVIAVGAPQTRELIAARAVDQGFSFETLIHPRTERSEWIAIGAGTLICAGNILTTNITLGNQVQINLDCTIGHDVVMGDYTTLAPGVHVSGWVHFGKRVYVGTGAVIINGTETRPIVIEDDAVIGAGACVTKSVGAGLTVVGVPARPLQRA